MTSYNAMPEGRLNSWVVGEQPILSSNEDFDAAGTSGYPMIPEPDYSPAAGTGAAAEPSQISSDRVRFRGENVSPGPGSTLRQIPSFYDNVPMAEDYSNSLERREYSIEPNVYGGTTYTEHYTKEMREVNTYDLRTNPTPRPSGTLLAEIWQPQADGSPPWAQQQRRAAPPPPPPNERNEREHNVKIVNRPNNVTLVEINTAPGGGAKQAGMSYSKRQTAL